MSEVSAVPFWTDEDFYGACDYVAPDAETCCDAPVAYRVTWKARKAAPELGNGACSAVCLRHVVKVDRNLVESIRTILVGGPRDLSGRSEHPYPSTRRQP